IGVSGVLLLIFSFFPWLGFSYGGFSASKSAWTFTLCWLAVILGVLMAGYVIAKAAGVDLPELGNLRWAHVLLGVAIVAFVFILIKVIVGPSTGGVDISGTGVSKDRKIGIFLGLLASIGLVAGAYLNAKETGDLPGSLGRGTAGGSTPPPPGPPPGPPTA
ncbi:MAG TPA: hypothetical protein VFW97_06725, partial [Acidimicrobiia bacterium]|nr:hypothetical protein [Acidimicrobiia bacterium]